MWRVEAWVAQCLLLNNLEEVGWRKVVWYHTMPYLFLLAIIHHTYVVWWYHRTIPIIPPLLSPIRDPSLPSFLL